MTTKDFHFDGLELPSSFSERYEPIKELGRGGLGIVLLAREKASCDLVAAKFLTVAFANTEDVRRFAREARLSFQLSHPNIIQGLDVGGAEDKVPYVVFEYVQGGTLFAAMRKGMFKERESTLRLVSGIGRGLAFAHSKGILHRDLKPANILLAKDGTPKIADFGLALVLQERERLTRTGVLMGTPSYMAPEQIEGSAIDRRADVYALAEITFELLAGCRPFEATDVATLFDKKLNGSPQRLHRLTKDLPRVLCNVVERGLNRAREARPQSVEEFLSELERVEFESRPLSLDETAKGGAPKQTGQGDNRIERAKDEGDKEKRYPTSLATFSIVATILLLLIIFFGRDWQARAKISQFEVATSGTSATLSFKTDIHVLSALEIVDKKGNTLSVSPISETPRLSHRGVQNHLAQGKELTYYILGNGKRIGTSKHLRTKRISVTVADCAATNIAFVIKWAKNCRCRLAANLSSSQEEVSTKEELITSDLFTVKLGPLPSKTRFQGTVSLFDDKRLIAEEHFIESTTEIVEEVLLTALHPKAKGSNAIFKSLTEGATSRAYSCPTVNNEQGYFVTERFGLIGFDLASKKIAWQRDEAFGDVKTVRFFNGHLAALASDKRRKKNLYCLNAARGTDEWSTDLDEDTYIREFLVTPTGAITIAQGKGIYCHSWSDGRLLWKVQSELRLPFALGRLGRLWVAGSSLKGVNTATGEVFVNIALPSHVNYRCRPIDLGNEVIVFLDDMTMAVYSVDTKRLLRCHKMEYLMDYTKYLDGRIYGVSEKAPYLLTALDAKTGEVIWKESLKEINGFNGLPSFTEKRIYGIGHKNCVISYDLSSGRLLWKSNDLAHATAKTIMRPNGILYVTVDLRLKRIIDRL